MKISTLTILFIELLSINTEAPNKQNDFQEIYLSPWAKLNRSNTQIMDFDSKGGIIIRKVPKQSIISLRKVMELLDIPASEINPATIQNITKQINSSKKNIRTKVLTNCNHMRTMCRFLTCRNVKKHCLLCEVNLTRGSTNGTICEKISTAFLSELKGVCLVHGSSSKPTREDELIELIAGRGIGSTVWGWITYPFTGWWSAEKDSSEMTGEEYIESMYARGLVKENVTVSCNEQMCKTVRCTKEGGCETVTCSIYDTVLTGECRIFSTTEKVYLSNTETTTDVTKDTSQTVQANDDFVDEHPIELEAVISSTVHKDVKTIIGQKHNNPPSPHNKV